MENKKFKNIHDQYVDFQKQNALHALKNAIYNYLWITADGPDLPESFTSVVSDIVEEFYKLSDNEN